MNWYMKVLRDYTVFSGRASRTEYWMFVLFNIIALIIAAIIDNILGTNFKYGTIKMPYGYIYLLYVLAVLIPSLAVTVRRLHDTGRTGWWILIGLIPIIGGIWLLVLMILESTPGENQYGPNPNEQSVTV